MFIAFMNSSLITGPVKNLTAGSLMLGERGSVSDLVRGKHENPARRSDSRFDFGPCRAPSFHSLLAFQSGEAFVGESADFVVWIREAVVPSCSSAGPLPALPGGGEAVAQLDPVPAALVAGYRTWPNSAKALRHCFEQYSPCGVQSTVRGYGSLFQQSLPQAGVLHSIGNSSFCKAAVPSSWPLSGMSSIGIGFSSGGPIQPSSRPRSASRV